MNYCLHITSAPHINAGANTGLLFARALLETQHQLSRVFFSGNGVHNANALSISPQDEQNIPQVWQDLARQHGIELQVCISSAFKHGIINESEARRYDKPQYNLLEGFELSGLGQLVEACMLYDRVIRF